MKKQKLENSALLDVALTSDHLKLLKGGAQRPKVAQVAVIATIDLT